MDFLDPSNMLGVWLSTGRHNWWNKEYDAMVNEAAENTDQEARIKTFQEAERLLVTDSPAVWIYHRTVADLYKPYISGSAFDKNIAGFSGIQWPGFSSMDNSLQNVYLTSDVTKVRSEPPK
jgi:peptide/nickel transport system substrate-binding protein/oligopeptide transport system substrate-binding protein